MKVILLQDVAKIGRRFQIVDVPDGYALNKLIPRRLAEAATAVNVKRVEARTNKQAATEADTLKVFYDLSKALKDVVVEITVEANAEGKMFEALKPQSIAKAAGEKVSLMCDEKWVHTATPIKSVGTHTVLLSHAEAQGEFIINVISKS